MSYCHGLGGNQLFAYTKTKQLIADDSCLDAASADGPVKLGKCHGLGGNQSWMFDSGDQTIRHVITGRCLTVGVGEDSPLLRECDKGFPGQSWAMDNNFKWQSSDEVR